ncbi:hypothetical protein J2X11_001488 [Aeromicrobium panaciterrae]|uniref:DUF4383 domain-containing protein n=1 Tax=Aeromicrobium panaciterrae TaxID=363861 RepID=A0ABU1UN90_9ACTN|nr:hypothetical protein [Aeromicrobium panaciterrae]MDR7086649.1 hypothetical protein [Aeromicrobium panaciterrae]
MAADFKALDKNVQGALIAGGLATILSFISSYISVSYDGKVAGLDLSYGISAWHSYATLGILLVIAATAILALKAFAADTLPDGVPWNLAAFGAAALGLVLLVLRAFTIGGGGGGISVGPGWSGYALFIAAAALTYFAFGEFKKSGDKLPERKTDTPPAA